MAKKSKTRIALGPNSYGKSRVRLVKVSRKGKVHTVREVSVDVSLSGDFDAIHTKGDNAKCLPTDTMKNTVYALGKDHPIDSIESFALHLARHFLARNKQVWRAGVQISETAWDRAVIRGHEHPHCFMKGSEERQRCWVTVCRQSEDPSFNMTVSAGLDGLTILKSTNSAFSGFPRNGFTTLVETEDRIFATQVSAMWTYGGQRREKAAFNSVRDQIRRALIETFATHKSRSVQHTIHAMGEAALRACKTIDAISLSMPNKHCLLANLAPFGMKNANEVFVPTDEPHGLIEAIIERR